MRIANNIMALNAHRQLMINQGGAAKSIEKLSSGFRINRAGDDAAGLAISEKMRGQIRGLNQAMRNAQDGISLIQTAEGALNETHAILQRMRELANQAANDTLTPSDRNEVQKEINQLTSEINRIGNTTEFNTQKLLRGDGRQNLAGTGLFADVKLSGGADAERVHATQTTTITTAAAADDTVTFTLNGIELTVTFADRNAGGQAPEAVYNVTGNSATVNLAEAPNADTTAAGLRAALEKMIEANDILRGNYSVSGNGANVTITATADGTFAGAAGNISEVAKIGTVTFDGGAADAGTSTPAVRASANIDLTTISSVADVEALIGRGMTIAGQQIEFYDANKGVYTGAAIGVNVSDVIGASTDFGAALVDAIVAQVGPQLTNVVLSHDTGNSPGELTVEAAIGGVAGNNLTVQDGGVQSKFMATLQVGANEGQSMTISLGDMRAAALGITGTGEGFTKELTVTDGTSDILRESALDVSNHANASRAITIIDQAIEKVSAERSNLGAMQNRLEHTINNLGTSAENLQAAESRIRDVDMAKEMMEFTKYQILQQASTAMLAQANLAPQSVLQLLG